MSKIFKDPSRHFKHSDHQNKPKITLVNGMSFKSLTEYIYNGIKELNDESILRSANQRGYSIIYFTDPKKTIENSIFKNKDEIKIGRAKLKLVIAGLIINAEKDANLATNSRIKVELTSLRKLVHDFDHDIKAGDLKKPLQKILNEITTPKGERLRKLTSPHRFTHLHVRGIDRQALSRFNKIDDLELNNLISLIFPNNNINPLDKEKLLLHIESSKNFIQSMQKFINLYIYMRTTTTSNLVSLAKTLCKVSDIEIFCKVWAETRKELPNDTYLKSKFAVHAWASQMDVIVAVLNRRLFQMQSANTPYSNIFSTKVNGSEKNIFSSPISPLGSITYDATLSPTDNLSPGYLIEDSGEKKLLETINKAKAQTIDKIKKNIEFTEPPSHPVDGGMQGQNSTEVTPSQAKDIKPNAFLSASLEEKLEHDVMSSSGEFYSFLSPIKSPTTFPQRRSSSTIANQQALRDEELNQLIADLSIKPNTSASFINFDNVNIEDYLNSEEINYFTNADYANTERTPEKPDPNATQSVQNKIQSIVRKASSKLTYEPMPTQQGSNTNPNPSITNAINNSTNNSFNNRN